MVPRFFFSVSCALVISNCFNDAFPFHQYIRWCKVYDHRLPILNTAFFPLLFQVIFCTAYFTFAVFPTSLRKLLELSFRGEQHQNYTYIVISLPNRSDSISSIILLILPSHALTKFVAISQKRQNQKNKTVEKPTSSCALFFSSFVFEALTFFAILSGPSHVPRQHMASRCSPNKLLATPINFIFHQPRRPPVLLWTLVFFAAAEAKIFAKKTK